MSVRSGFLSIGFVIITITAYCQSPGLAWVGVFGGDNTKQTAQIAVDASGNVYTVGGFYGTFDADPLTTEHLLTSEGGMDAFIVKQNEDGEFQWVVQLGDFNTQSASTVDVDANGDVIVSGYFEGTVDFDPGGGVTLYTSPSSSAFMMKLSSSGNLVWARAFNNIDGASTIVDISIDPTNSNIFIAGQLISTADVDPSGTVFNLVSVGNFDMWFGKYTPAGTLITAASAGGPGSDYPTAIILNADEEVVATGVFTGTADLAPGPAVATFVASVGEDAFFLKLSNSLAYLWGKQIATTGSGSLLYVGDLATDASDNIIFNGTLSGSADFDPGTGVVTLTGVNSDFFVASYNTLGNLNWAKKAGGLEGETATALAVDGSGNIFMVGRFGEQFDIDPDAAVNIIAAQSPGWDLYFAKFNSSGNLLWHQPIPSGDFIEAVHMVIDNASNIYITGEWNGTVDFSTNTCVDGSRVTSDNALAFTVKFAPSTDISCFGFLEHSQSGPLGCAGVGAILSAPAGGTTNITYQWQIFNGSTWSNINDQEEDSGVNGYAGTKTPYLDVYPALGGDEGDLRVEVKGDGVPTIYSEVFSLVIKSTPPVPGVTATSGCGAGYHFLQAFGTTSDFNWYIDDVEVDDADTDVLSYFFNTNAIVGVSVTDGGCEGDRAVLAINTDECIQAPGVVWAQQLGPEFTTIVAMVIDNNDDIYIAGQFSGPVDFDLGSGTFTMTPNGSSDYFVAKYSYTGNFLWAKQTDMIISDIATGGADDVYYVGSFTGTVDFDPGPTTFNMTVSGSGRDMAIVYLEGDGTFDWAKQLVGTSGESGNQIRAVADTPTSEIVITGNFTKTVDFNPSTGVFNLVSALSSFPDIFVAKYTHEGDLVWAKRMGAGTNVNRGNDIEVDGSGNIYTVGVFQSTVDFNPGTNAGETFNLASAGQTDAFVQSLDLNGNFRWAKRFGASGPDEAVSVDLDDSDNPVVAGHFTNIVDFDPDGGTFEMSSGLGPSFVVRLNATGGLNWARQTGGEVVQIFVDDTDKVLITGFYEGDIDVDPGPDIYKLETAVTADIYVSQLEYDGSLLWAYNTNGSGLEYFENKPAAVAMDSEGNFYLAGTFTNMIDVNPTQCTYPLQASSSTREAFFHKVRLNLATICFAQQPTDVAECEDTQIHLVAEAIGTDNITYKWQRYNTTFGYYEDISSIPGYSGVDGPELFIDATTSFGAGTYRAYVTGDHAGDAGSNEATVTVSTPPSAPTTTPVTFCSPGQKMLTIAGGTSGEYRWYEDISAPAIAGATEDHFETPFLTSTTSFYATRLVNGCESSFVQVDATLNLTLPAPAVTDGISCSSPSSVTLAASGATGGQDYRWYHNEDDPSPEDEYEATYNTGPLSATRSYFVAIGDGACESLRVEVLAQIGSAVTPTGSTVNNCGPGAFTLTASGGTDGDYRWYTQASGGSAIAGATNNTFVTPVLTATTQYYVTLDDGSCESPRVLATAVIDTPPAPPASNNATICTNATAALTATTSVAGGEIRWYAAASGGSPLQTGGTFTTPNLTVTTTYHVSVFDTKCESTRTAVVVTVNACTTNSPPVIVTTVSSAGVAGSTTINLLELVSDPDNNLNLTTLKVVVQPTSGAVATIDQNGQLRVDYSSVSFTGEDELTIEICDTNNVCTREIIRIKVSGNVEVFNAVSPNGDGKNDILYLEFIDLITETRDNKVTIFNRWGSPVFEIEDYNNTTNVFSGKNNSGNELPSGTYFYRIEYGNTSKTGYLSLKR